MHTVAGVTPCFLQTDNMEEVRRMQAEDNIIGPVLEAIQPGKPQSLMSQSPGVGRAAFCFNSGICSL